MVLLAVTHAHTAIYRAVPLRLTGYAHDTRVAPFTSKKHGLLLSVFIQHLVA